MLDFDCSCPFYFPFAFSLLALGVPSLSLYFPVIFFCFPFTFPFTFSCPSFTFPLLSLCFSVLHFIFPFPSLSLSINFPIPSCFLYFGFTLPLPSWTCRLRSFPKSFNDSCDAERNFSIFEDKPHVMLRK